MNLKKPKFWDYQRISIWAIVLFPLTIFYRFVFFIIKVFKSTRKFPIPIICVGNIYLGGTGKTPWLWKFLKFQILNKNPAFVNLSLCK